MTYSNSFEQVKPNLQLLTREQIEEVHKYSINILENTGIKVESKTAIKIFAKSGSVRIENEVVYIQEELINHSIKSAQSSVDIFNKNGDFAFQLGGNQQSAFFGIGVTNTYFQDIETDQVEPFKRHHMQLGSQLGDMLNNYEMISTLGVSTENSHNHPGDRGRKRGLLLFMVPPPGGGRRPGRSRVCREFGRGSGVGQRYVLGSEHLQAQP